MDLILLLLLSGGLLAIRADDKRKKKAADREYEETYGKRRKIFYDFYRRFAAEEFQFQEAKNQIISSEPEAKEMRKRLAEEAGIDYPSDDMLLLALLAQLCKIPSARIHNGGFSRCSLATTHVTNAEYNDLQWKFLLWYDRELQNHGFPYRLVVLFTTEELKRFHEGDPTLCLTPADEWTIRDKHDYPLLCTWAPIYDAVDPSFPSKAYLSAATPAR